MKNQIWALFLLVSTSAVSAQNYSINWHKIAGGGGTSTGGPYSLSGTVGQPDASNSMTGGGFSFTGGFWALFAVQTPGAPTLYIKQSGTTVSVYWQNVPGWTLQQNSNLSVPTGWAASSGVIASNGTNYLNLPNPTGHLFFRLAGP